jgi:toxin ParE1/3/4
MKVVFAEPAETDLEQIGDFIAKDNPPRSLSFVKELRTAAKGLARFPRRFPRALGVWPGEVRRRVHGNYLLIYRVETGQVTILRILHGARDYEALAIQVE